MAVIPEGAALIYLKLIMIGIARLYPIEAEPGNPIHIRGQDNAMPVDGTVMGKVVLDSQRNCFAFLPA